MLVLGTEHGGMTGLESLGDVVFAQQIRHPLERPVGAVTPGLGIDAVSGPANVQGGGAGRCAGRPPPPTRLLASGGVVPAGLVDAQDAPIVR